MVDDPGYQTIVCSLRQALHHPGSIPIWLELVHQAHTAVTTIYLFSKYFFIHALNYEDFDPESYIKTGRFFTEVLKTIDAKPRAIARTNQTKIFRRMIQQYLDGFRIHYPFQNIQLQGTQSNLWAYEGNTISTVYLNNIQEHLGNHIRKTLNQILDLKTEKRSLRREAQTFLRQQAELSFLYPPFY